MRQVHRDLHWIPCYLPFDSGNHDYEVDDNYDDDDHHDDDSDNYDYGDEDDVKCVDDDYHVIQDFWRLLPSKSLTDRQLLADFTTRVPSSRS